MSIEARREYLKAIRERYAKAERGEKGKILDEYCAVCGYSRKYAIRALRGLPVGREKKPGPPSKFSEECIYHLVQMWEVSGRMCSKKLVAALPLWFPFYKDPLCHTKMREQILGMSSATIDRLLRPFRAAHRRGLSTTDSVNLLKIKIPIELLHGTVTEPGHIEADTVAHCGDSTAGTYASSVTMTDLYSGWTENRAVWRKTAGAVTACVQGIDQDLPFLMRSFSSDNGDEFINKLLYKYLQTRPEGRIQMTRRRPYRKNDAAHVEQKNYTHVRQLFGYDRLDDPLLVAMMNEIYRAYWNPLLNFFTPCMKLVRKERVGARIRKYYEPRARTPFERLMESESLSQREKQRLLQRRNGLNPFLLKDLLMKRLREFRHIVRLNEENRRFCEKRSA
jgi:hypothetical protein